MQIITNTFLNGQPAHRIPTSASGRLIPHAPPCHCSQVKA